MWDVSKLSTLLFGMGFEPAFVRECEYTYGWNFAHLFQALYDGSFYKNDPHGETRGQDHLRGFATFLCGVFVGNEQYRSNLNSVFEKSLLDDGYDFVEGKLTEESIDTNMAPEVRALPDRTALVHDLSVGIDGDEPVAVLFLDLDHFKEVNDRLGHTSGNDCLANIVGTIAEALRRKGKLYRVGGDEFCAVLPNFATAEAAVTAERVRAAIDALKPFGGVVKVTASIGVAGSDANQLVTAESLVKAADEAMYVAKFTGKNRIAACPLDPEKAAQADARRKGNVGR
jgi:diguanylate cyclase (GGDEF)-like protein